MEISVYCTIENQQGTSGILGNQSYSRGQGGKLYGVFLSAGVALTVEHLICNQRVVGSNPASGSRKKRQMFVKERLSFLYFLS